MENLTKLITTSAVTITKKNLLLIFFNAILIFLSNLLTKLTDLNQGK